MKQSTTQLGQLNCIIVDASDGEPELVVVLCHGFGAPGTDLVGLGEYIVQLDPSLNGRVRFVFPAAPLSLEEMGMPGARAWWPLDMVKLQTAMATGEFRDLRNDEPPELPNARDMLLGLLAELETQWNVPIGRVVLGGFSQGSMLATDVTLRLPTPPAALCVWSGTLLSESAWRELAAQHPGVPVFQSHGRQDTILPFAAAEWLRDLLTESGFDVEFMPFNGPHSIPPDALERTALLIRKCLDGDAS